MLSIEFIKNNTEAVKEAAKNKNRVVDIDKILELDEKRKKIIIEVDVLRAEANKLAKLGGAEESRDKGRELKNKIKELDEWLAGVEKELEVEISRVPNVPLPEVPIGKDESGNVVIKKWGKPRQFDFEPKSHIELGEALDILDVERGSKVSGFRGYFLKNELALLHFGLLFYVMQKLSKKGYIPLIAPSIVKGFTLFGTGQFPWGEPEVYKLNDDDAYLAGTSEVAVTSYFAKETLKEEDLPKKFVAVSPCFRKEAGSYGKDAKGIYRIHEFWKVEQVIIGKADVDEARKLHEELQRNSEEILEELKIPYQTLLMCSGDMGEPQIKKYDIESWMPSRNGYGETMSNSIMGDFQARRLGIKYKNKEGKSEFCYTLNDTALASPRFLIALLENYQNKDGSIDIPKAIQKFVGVKKIKPKK